MTVTAATIRAAALRTLSGVESLQDALNAMGFVQADPIRSPARAQDLTLMQRVPGYRAGDLERLYPRLDAEEDMIPNYGFVPRHVQALLHPREVNSTRIEREHPELLDEVRALLHQKKEVHPKQVIAILGQRKASNYWGGQSSATTRALDALHYRGEARVTRRVSGVRVYGLAPHLEALKQSPIPEEERLHKVVHLLAALYGPLPESSLSYLIGLSHFGFPHLRHELKATFKRVAKEELSSAKVDGLKYVWPAEWSLDDLPAAKGVRIVGPFDPLVWDRRRFAHLHGWAYRFEAYTPPAKRTMGYYALPIFQADKAIGWANLKVVEDELNTEFGFAPGIRQTAALQRGLEAEVARYRTFLNLDSAD